MKRPAGHKASASTRPYPPAQNGSAPCGRVAKKTFPNAYFQSIASLYRWLDPCGLVIVAHGHRNPSTDEDGQKFFCHYECFRRLIGDLDEILMIDDEPSTRS